MFVIDKIKLQVGSHTVDAAEHTLALANQYEKDGKPTMQGIELTFNNGTKHTYGSVKYERCGLHLESKHGKLYLTVNPRRFVTQGGRNVGDMTKDQFVEIMAMAAHHLSTQAGITVNLDDAKVTRVDFSYDAATEKPFAAYKPALEDLVVSRLNRVIYETGVSYQNTQFAMVVYDKLAELRVKQFGLNGLPDNLLRWEVRFLSVTSVAKKLGISTYSQLLAEWDRIGSVCISHIQGALNMPTAGGTTVSVVNVLEDLAAIAAAKGNRDSFNELVKFYGIHQLVTLIGNVKTLDQVLKEHGFDAKARWRYRRFIHRHLSEMTGATDTTKNELREELSRYYRD